MHIKVLNEGINNCKLITGKIFTSVKSCFEVQINVFC